MNSRILFIAVLLFVSLIFLPATAADNTTSPHTLEIRQAHLAWIALDKDIEMDAAITYCNTLYGADTTTMSRLLSEFQAEQARITQTMTEKEIDALVHEMRNTTSQFRGDMYVVMTKGQGNWDTFSEQVLQVKDNNPYILEKKERYWAVRTANHLADFDAWVNAGQQELDTLQAEGYDTTAAQRALDVFSAKRPDVKAALATKTEIAVQRVNQQTLPLSVDFITKLGSFRDQVPDSTRFLFFIEQGGRAAGHADQVNSRLVPILLDIGDAETVLSKMKTDLGEAKRLLSSGNLGSTKTPLRLVRKDMTDLAQAYREIAKTTDLPADFSAELGAMARRLDNAADQMGAAL
jgi:hypothetical protein